MNLLALISNRIIERVCKAIRKEDLKIAQLLNKC